MYMVSSVESERGGGGGESKAQARTCDCVEERMFLRVPC